MSEVNGHARCHPSYKEAILSDIAGFGHGLAAKCDAQQVKVERMIDSDVVCVCVSRHKAS